MLTDSFTIDEIKEAFFFSLKRNKSPRYNEITFINIKNCFSEVTMELKYLFQMSLEGAIFPNKLKITTTIHKILETNSSFM